MTKPTTPTDGAMRPRTRFVFFYLKGGKERIKTKVCGGGAAREIESRLKANGATRVVPLHVFIPPGVDARSTMYDDIAEAKEMFARLKASNPWMEKGITDANDR